MGYSYATVDWLGDLDLAPNSRVLDLGSQDLYLNTQPGLERVNSFIARYGGKPLDRAEQIPTADLWKRAGFDYRCVDLDHRPGTIRIDLQDPRFPKFLKSEFDLVVNAGTTEHLANPVCGLAFAHFACRPGGIIAHDVPLFGYGNHGLTNPTPKFWVQLCKLNRYKPLSASVRQVAETPDDPNFFHESMRFIEGLDQVRGVTWMIRMAVRKTAPDRPFLPPADYAPGASPIQSQAKKVLRPIWCLVRNISMPRSA